MPIISNLHDYSGAMKLNPYSAGIDFRRQILTSKVDPRVVRVQLFILAVYI